MSAIPHYDWIALRVQFVGTGKEGLWSHVRDDSFHSAATYLDQRHVVVLTDALQDQESERGLAGIGHQMRPAGYGDIALAHAKSHFCLGVLQEEPHLAFQHIER